MLKNPEIRTVNQYRSELTISHSNAPINVKPHYPPPGLTKGIGGDLTFRKIKFSTHRGTTGGQISVYYGWNAL